MQVTAIAAIAETVMNIVAIAVAILISPFHFIRMRFCVVFVDTHTIPQIFEKMLKM